MAGYTDNQTAYDLLSDNNRLRRVPVIATYSADGHMKPLYFSIEGIRIRVDRVVFSEKTGYGRCYRCEITLGDRVQSISLSYFEHAYSWTLHR